MAPKDDNSCLKQPEKPPRQKQKQQNQTQPVETTIDNMEDGKDDVSGVDWIGVKCSQESDLEWKLTLKVNVSLPCVFRSSRENSITKKRAAYRFWIKQ